MKAKVIMLEITKESNIVKTTDANRLHYNLKIPSIAIGDHSNSTFVNIYLTNPNAEIKTGDYYYDSFYKRVFKYEGDTQELSFEYCSKIICSTDKSLKTTSSIGNQGTVKFEPLPQLSEQSKKLFADYYNKNGKMPDEVGIKTLAIKDASILKLKNGIETVIKYASCSGKGRKHDVFPAIYLNKEVGYCFIEDDWNVDFTHKTNNALDIISIDSKSLYVNSEGAVDITIPEEKKFSEEEVKRLIKKAYNDFRQKQPKTTGRHYPNKKRSYLVGNVNDWIDKNL
jgi:hypothetical protein